MNRRCFAFLALGLLACGIPATQSFEVKSLPPGVYRVRDNGIRCFDAPCPTYDITPVGPGEGTSVSTIEYPSAMPQEERKAVQERMFQPDGAVARGFVNANVEGGLFVLEAVEP
jgi:hypothetical protein